MRILFYAPLKPPDSPVPSGDRRMARLIEQALRHGGHTVERAARLRSLDIAGDADRQARIAMLGGRLSARLIARLRRRPFGERPHAFLTYHLYYKAPDWIGPSVAAALSIPYVVIEASIAEKRATGAWAGGHRAVCQAMAQARAAISVNPADEDGLRPYVAAAERLHRMPPFLDAGPFAQAAHDRIAHRRAVARAFDLDPGQPWLLAVAMMRPGDKLASYRHLGAALARCRDRRWQLLVVGDGLARQDVAAALAPVAASVRMAGLRGEAELPALYAACDLFVWPAINEAYGMAILEAQAAGLPAVVGDAGGVGEIVSHDRTGFVLPCGDDDAFAGAVAALLDDPDRRRAMGAAARAKVARLHDLDAASAALTRVLAAAGAS
ncbi:MAG: glycosyltransferase family 4 protein [Alphaproteobacteria bacterium]|nr:glycosyltransferase family 4 protein [Alphaproteobacteria bacterium]